jgi:hypothetical protein
VWCHWLLIGSYIFPQRLTGDIYANFLQDELPALLDNIPLQTRWQMYYQHDRTPPHYNQVIRQYVNHKFPNWWTGSGGTQNWSPRPPDLNPFDYHVWGYMKAMVYAHKVNTREELFQRILSAARSINNAAVLHKVTSSLVTSQKSHPSRRRTLQQFAWVLNSESVMRGSVVNNTSCFEKMLYSNKWNYIFQPVMAIIRFPQWLRWVYIICVRACWWRDLYASIPCSLWYLV